MSTDELRAIRDRIGDRAPVHEQGVIWGVLDALRATLDVLIAANDTGVSHRDADDGAGKGSGASSLPPLAGADASDVSVEGRSEIGPQKGVQSLGDDLREFADRAIAALAAERDEARAEVESLQRAAQVTDASWREHVERAEKAEAAVARVRKVHRHRTSRDGRTDWCESCEDGPWPCATVTALDGVDAGGEGK